MASETPVWPAFPDFTVRERAGLARADPSPAARVARGGALGKPPWRQGKRRARRLARAGHPGTPRPHRRPGSPLWRTV